MCCQKRILGISWRDKVPNNTVTQCWSVTAGGGVTSMYTILKKRFLRWLDRVSSLDDGRVLKDLL